MIRVALVLLALAACGGPRSPTAAPIAGHADPAAPAAVVAPTDALCCCTFDIAMPEDLGEVATWDSLATTCATGDGARMPGQCIDWRWCGYSPGGEPRSLADRPDLAPAPPMAAGDCCCDVWDGHGETFSVLAHPACAQQPYGACVDAAFCR